MSGFLKSRLLGGVAAAAVFAMAAGGASATIIPNFVSATLPSGGTSTFLYKADLTNDEQMTGSAPDYFTLYDIPGVANVSAPVNWVFSIQNTGTTPSNVSPPDNGSIPNVTFTYTGPTPILGPADFPGFSFTTTASNLSTLGNFSSQAQKLAPGNASNGTDVQSVGLVTLPSSNGAPIPEPGTVAMFAAGLPLLGIIARKRSTIQA